MKKITLDYQTYMQEHVESKDIGFKNGIAAARRMFLELIAGASDETMLELICDYEDAEHEAVHKLLQDIGPRFPNRKIANR